MNLIPLRTRDAALPQRVDLGDERQGFARWVPPRGVRALLAIDLFAAALYLAWWLQPGRAGTPALFWMLAGAEAFNMVHLVGFWWAIHATRVEPPPPIRTTHSIDVFIPTRGEPLAVLRRTISAAVAMEGAHTTYVLDDARRATVRTLARSLGARYIAREGSTGAKAGNLNNGLRETSSDLVVIFDADHVPRPDFLARLLGYFEDPSVAFVQTPQFYANSADNEVARGAFEQQAIFYGPICRGKNGLDSAFCCGTNVIFRRAALDEVDGFNERSVVEDFVTSMRIHAKGWRSVYYPYVLAEGLGPADLGQYVRQQYRWARGSIGALMSGEVFRRGLSVAQRMQYLLATTFYLIGIVTAVYVVLPLLYVFGGWGPFSAQSSNFVFFYAPYLALALMTIRWGLGKRFRIDQIRYTFGSFPVYAVAGIAAILHLPARFRVTGVERSRRTPPFLTLVAVGAFVLTGIAIALAPVLRPLDARTVTSMSWGAINMMLLWGIVRVALREWTARPVKTTVSIAAVSHGSTLILPEHAIERDVHVRTTARLRPAWSVGLLTAFGLGTRLAWLNTQSLRHDEFLSISQASGTIHSLWTYLLTVNVHVPLYHTVLHWWMGVFGKSVVSIRMPSLLLGAACIPLTYLVAKRLIGARGAILATAITASSPFLEWHADEARMYPMVLFFVLASTALMLRGLEKGGVWTWSAYSLTMGLGFYTHYYFLMIPAVHFVYVVILRKPRTRAWSWLLATAAAFMLFMPWMVALYVNRISPFGVSSLTNGAQLQPPSYTAFGLIYSFIIFLAVYLTGYHTASIVQVIAAIVAGIWPIAILRSGIREQRTRDPERARSMRFLGAWAFLTIGAGFVASLLQPGLFFQRYLTVAAPALFLILASGLARAFRRRPGFAVALVLVTLTTATVFQNIETHNPERQDFRGVVGYIAQTATPSDVVWMMPAFDIRGIRYYIGDRKIPTVAFEEETDFVVNSRIPEVARDHPGAKMFFVLDHRYTTAATKFDPVVPRAIDLRFVRLSTATFGLFEVRAYQLPKAPKHLRSGDTIVPTEPRPAGASSPVGAP